MRDCYYVFIPGGARKSSSIQLARRSQAAVLGSRYYVPTAVERRRRGDATRCVAYATYFERHCFYENRGEKGRAMESHSVFIKILLILGEGETAFSDFNDNIHPFTRTRSIRIIN